MSDNQSTVAPVPYQDAAVAPPPEVVAPSSGGGGLLAMIERLATPSDINIDVFERLLAARRAEEDRAAMRAFNIAMSNAKGEIQPVLKTREVDFTSARTQTRTKYKYESFSDVARVVDPVFSRHGLSYRFRVAQAADVVKVTCIVSHSDGYSEENAPLETKVDPGSTGMSMVQALGSALTFLQRYSLRSAIGLPAGVDDDGRGAGGTSPRISESQASELAKLLDETGRSEATLLRLIGVENIIDMNVDQFTRAKEVLELAKAGQKAGTHAPAGN
jgi:predicted DNA-binding protein